MVTLEGRWKSIKNMLFLAFLKTSSYIQWTGGTLVLQSRHLSVGHVKLNQPTVFSLAAEKVFVDTARDIVHEIWDSTKYRFR